MIVFINVCRITSTFISCIRDWIHIYILASETRRPLSTLSLTMTSFPISLITGTIAFLVLGVVCVGGVFASLASGTVSKDNAA